MDYSNMIRNGVRPYWELYSVPTLCLILAIAFYVIDIKYSVHLPHSSVVYMQCRINVDRLKFDDYNSLGQIIHSKLNSITVAYITSAVFVLTQALFSINHES